jgi:hypothetical protein
MMNDILGFDSAPGGTGLTCDFERFAVSCSLPAWEQLA